MPSYVTYKDKCKSRDINLNMMAAVVAECFYRTQILTTITFLPTCFMFHHENRCFNDADLKKAGYNVYIGIIQKSVITHPQL